MSSSVGKNKDKKKSKNINVRYEESMKDSLFWAQCDEEFAAAEVYHTQKRYSKGLATYIELAQYGYPAAMYRIGEYYRDGNHALKMNKQLGHKFMLNAAKKNYAPAQHEVALMYRSGDGCKQDILAAIHWFEKAVEQGYAASEFELGKAYLENGDSIEGAALLRKSSLQKNPEALYLYGQYMISKNIECDSLIGTPPDAIKQAAELSDRNAMLYMMRYEDSCANYKAAYGWAFKLRAQKSAEGIRYLADCYRYGRGVKKKNKRLAKDFYRDAARAGDKEARRILEDW